MAGRTCYARRTRANMRDNGKSSQGISPERSAHLKTCTPNRSQSIGGLSGVPSGGVARSALTVGYPAETLTRRGPARLALTFGTPEDAETDKELSMVMEGTWGAEDDRARMYKGQQRSGSIQKMCPQPTGAACPRYLVLRCPRSASWSMLYTAGNVRPLSECLEHVMEQLDEQLPLASFAHPRHHGAHEPLPKDSTRPSPSAANRNHYMSQY